MNNFKITSPNTIEAQITNSESTDIFIIEIGQSTITLRKKNHSHLSIVGLNEDGVRAHGLGMFEKVIIHP